MKNSPLKSLLLCLLLAPVSIAAVEKQPSEKQETSSLLENHFRMQRPEHPRERTISRRKPPSNVDTLLYVLMFMFLPKILALFKTT